MVPAITVPLASRTTSVLGHAIVLSVADDLAGAECYLVRAFATDMLKIDVSFYTCTLALCILRRVS